MNYKFVDVDWVRNTARRVFLNQCRHNFSLFSIISFLKYVDPFLGERLDNFQRPIGRPIVYHIQVVESEQIAVVEYPFVNILTP